MIAAIWIVGVMVGLIAIVLIVGLMLPQNHSAIVSARINAPPEAVFSAITNWREFPTWRSGMKSVHERQGTDGRASWIEVTKSGTIPFELEDVTPPNHAVGRIADAKLPFGGTWTYDVTPDGDGSRLSIREDGEVYNPLFRFMSRYVFGYTATMQTYLKDLGEKFGQEVQIKG